MVVPASAAASHEEPDGERLAACGGRAGRGQWPWVTDMATQLRGPLTCGGWAKDGLAEDAEHHGEASCQDPQAKAESSGVIVQDLCESVHVAPPGHVSLLGERSRYSTR
jgi:hypothetical protein